MAKDASSYSFGDDKSSRRMFNVRTLETDASYLVAHLRKGIRILDTGCGAGSITLGLAEEEPSADVLGIDISEDGIGMCTEAAQQKGLSNIRFEVGDAYNAGLEDASRDLVNFSGVLCHLTDPDRALDEADRVLAPGGVLAAREPNKRGDWFAGPDSEYFTEFNDAVKQEWRSRGIHPDVGETLAARLAGQGYEDVQTWPAYSDAMADARNLGQMMAAFLRDGTGPAARFVETGLIPVERVKSLADGMVRWAESEGAVSAISEVVAIGRKPG